MVRALYATSQQALPQPPSASAKGWHCRAARAADVPAVHALIVELARFEQAEDEVNLSVAQLRADFDAGRYECLCVEPEDGGAVVGFALVFHTYSTWEGTCLYLEDLFVLEHARGEADTARVAPAASLRPTARRPQRRRHPPPRDRARRCRHHPGSGRRRRCAGARNDRQIACPLGVDPSAHVAHGSAGWNALRRRVASRGGRQPVSAPCGVRALKRGPFLFLSSDEVGT